MNQIAYCCVVLQMKHNESNNNFGFCFTAAFEFVPFLLHFRVVFHFVTLTSNRPISSDNKKSHRPCLIAPRTANNATTRQQEAEYFCRVGVQFICRKMCKAATKFRARFRTFRCSIGITSYQQLALIIPTKIIFIAIWAIAKVHVVASCWSRVYFYFFPGILCEQMFRFSCEAPLLDKQSTLNRFLAHLTMPSSSASWNVFFFAFAERWAEANDWKNDAR